MAPPENTASDSNTGDDTVRRASAPKFANLTEMKRGAGAQNAQANRQSFTEQTKTPGSLGSMWDSFTKGTTHPK
ncbi:hypothetical protein BDY17DRAFT_326569 [Neohortaea acidophila]|uniref:Uncharacterized protein n=1 Tax=Neohortaea acidophila TaxID=245834 RepID=A0A6A6PLJ4_9PEZI|nr:uncharacterized protein BDY17DRAFT_326569 [Neohortaea acidophila]KAF2480686.1 hypothetical protein BDY17DRAFT_326569 [Neohortaea acidophila]